MKGAFGIELLANREISEIQNPIFGSSAMILGVLAEILQLLKCLHPSICTTLAYNLKKLTPKAQQEVPTYII